MSEHRHVALKDQRVAPTQPGRRAARRAEVMEQPPYDDNPYSGFHDDEPPKGRRRAGRKGGGGGRIRVVGWISIVLTCVMVLGTLAAYALYRNTLGNITRRDVTAALGKNRPVNSTGALNVLIVGSDTRAGDNKKYGQNMAGMGERTDTIIMMHVSPARDKAMLLSFPRDSMVQQPECVSPTTKARIAPRLDMINAAFNDGGIVCTIKTIESLTKIRVDHYIKVDFTGFKNIVNALDGIRICLPQAINDKNSKLNLPAGWQNVRGEAALGYVRLRHVGDGSDISRIKRQQVFLSQVVKKATSSDLITSPTKLLGFVTAAAQSVEMDSELNVETLIEIAQSARKLTSSGVKFVTIPWEPYAADKNRVQWKQPDATNLFNSVRTDVDLPTATPTAKASTATATGAAKSTTPPKVAIKPNQVRIQVLNGTNTAGKAKEVAEALAAEGFKVTEVGNAVPPGGADQAKTRLLYSAKAADGADYAAPVAAKLLAKVTPASGKVKPTGVPTPFTPSVTTSTAASVSTTTLTGPVIQLIIGTDWDGVKTAGKIPDSASVVDSNTDACKV